MQGNEDIEITAQEVFGGNNLLFTNGFMLFTVLCSNVLKSIPVGCDILWYYFFQLEMDLVTYVGMWDGIPS